MIRNAVLWISTRIGVAYLLAALFILFVCDEKFMKERIQLRRLNDSRPPFSELIAYRLSGRPMDPKPFQRYFELVFKYVPEDAASRLVLGYIEFKQGRAEKAVALLKHSEQLNPGLFWNSYDLGFIYYQKEDYAGAMPHLLTAVRMTPDIIVSQMFSSVIYRQIFAVPSYNANLEKEVKKGLSGAYVLLLDNLWHLKRYKEMVLFGQSAIARKDLPNQDAFFFYTGLALLELNDTQHAYIAFNKSLETNKDSPLIYYFLSRIFQGMGRPEESLLLLQKAALAKGKGRDQMPYISIMEPGF